MAASTKPQDVQLLSIQDRRKRGTAKPWITRWKVDGREHSRAFQYKEQAEAYRDGLKKAARGIDRFDPVTGEPERWNREVVTLAQFAKDFLKANWRTWSPHSRNDFIKAMVVFLPRVLVDGAPVLNEEGTMTGRLKKGVVPDDFRQLRDAIGAWLPPKSSATMPERLGEYSLPLEQFTKDHADEAAERMMARLDGRGSVGTPTATRRRTLCKQLLKAAVEAEHLTSAPWPKPESNRKVNKKRGQIDVEQLPDPRQARAMLAAMLNGLASGRAYFVLSALVYFGGLRPSEARALDAQKCQLPAVGWGLLKVQKAVTKASVRVTGEDEDVGYPKTGEWRDVPIPPELVLILREHLDERGHGLVVATSSGQPIGLGHWAEGWAAVRTNPEWKLYSLRHACATLWIRAEGAPLKVVAARLGHSVQVLMTTYAGALPDDAARANAGIEKALGSPGTVVRFGGEQDDIDTLGACPPDDDDQSAA